METLYHLMPEKIGSPESWGGPELSRGKAEFVVAFSAIYCYLFTAGKVIGNTDNAGKTIGGAAKFHIPILQYEAFLSNIRICPVAQQLPGPQQR